MVAQNQLRVLMAVYNRRMVDIAAQAGMPLSTVSAIVNCTRTATQEQIARLEDAISGRERLSAVA